MNSFCGLKLLQYFLPGTGGEGTWVDGPWGRAPSDADGTHCLVSCMWPVWVTQFTGLPPLCWLVPFNTLHINKF